MKFIIIILLYVINSIGLSQTTKWNVIWDKNPEKDIKEYIVYKNNEEISRVKNPDTVFVDDDLQPGKLYSYKIRAVNEKNIPGNFSAPVTAAIPGFKDLPEILGITKNKPINLSLKKYISDPDDKVHEIIRIDRSSDSKILLTLENENLVFKAGNNWNENDTDTAKIKVIDSKRFFNVAKIVIKDASIVGEFMDISLQDLNIKFFPEEFSLCDYNEISFSNIPQNCNISIYNSFGTLVFAEENISDSFEWDAENHDGDQVLFGLYNFVIYNKFNKILYEGSFRVIP